MAGDAITWALRTFAVLLGALAAFGIVAFVVGTQSMFGPTGHRAITVVGEAAMAVHPDKVDIAATVSTAATTTAEALDKNNERVAAVLAGLKADGIAAKDIRTSGFSIAPQHPKVGEYAENALVTTGYVVTNSIVVTLSADAYSGKIVDRLVRLGSTAVERVDFYAEHSKEFEDAVREQAAQNARARAERIVKALGAKLGAVVTIGRENQPDEDQAGYPAPQIRPRGNWSPENAPTLELMPQSQTVSATLHVTFAIE